MLKSFLDKYKEGAAEAAIVPQELDPRVAAGGEAIKRKGERTMVEAKAEYLSHLPSVLKVIAISGTYSQSFADFSKKLIGITTLNYTGVVDQLTAAINERSSRDSFSNQEYEMLLDELNKLKIELGASVLSTPHFSSDDQASQVPIKTAVKMLIERTFGNDLYALTTRVAASKAAFESKYDGEQFPVIVYNYNSGPTQFLPVPVRAAAIEQIIDENDVKGALHGINSSLKGLLSHLNPKPIKNNKQKPIQNNETQE